MQRIRIGLTGLAFVFLLVLLGTVISRGGDEATGNSAAENLAEPNDPLAELGVAPAQEADVNSSNAQRNAVQ